MNTVGPSDFEGIVSNLTDGLYFTDTRRNIQYWNKAAERITGFTAAEVVGKSCQDNVLCHVDSFGNTLCKGICPLAACMVDGKSREVEVYLHHKSGHRVPVLVRVNPVRDVRGVITGAIELFTDLSAGEFLWDRLQTHQRLALIDVVTELPNRKYLEQQFASQIAQLDRFQLPFGVVSFTIQDFQIFLQRHGNQVADRMLRVLADTLRSNLRPYDTVGRFDADEFMGIFPNVDTFSLNALVRRLVSLIHASTITDLEENQLYLQVTPKCCMAAPEESMAQLLERMDENPLTLSRP